VNARLNYHHLQYFWAVAHDGNLTRTAERLRVAKSALSAQIRQLEEQLDARLFVRQGRTLGLTEAGRIALDYADGIFTTGDELLEILRDGRAPGEVLRIGAVATLSRNFQTSFVKPLLGRTDLRLQLVSGTLNELLARLAAHTLDLVLTNRAVASTPGRHFRARHVARQKVSLVGHPRRKAFRFPHDLERVPLLLPGPESAVRASFDAICQKLGVRTHVLAEVDDMALMRLLARDTEAVALLPPVVVRDELRARVLRECCAVPRLYEDFYAITVERRYPHPLVEKLLSSTVDELLRPAS